MSCSLSYASMLRQRGHRVTAQRLLILHVLKSQPGHHTAKKICDLARPLLPTLTESTVYRTLEFLLRQGWVSPSLDAEGNLTYELNVRPHHHLICRRCGKDVELGDEMLQGLYQQIESLSGFRLEVSHLTFWGLCAECAAKSDSS